MDAVNAVGRLGRRVRHTAVPAALLRHVIDGAERDAVPVRPAERVPLGLAGGEAVFIWAQLAPLVPDGKAEIGLVARPVQRFQRHADRDPVLVI